MSLEKWKKEGFKPLEKHPKVILASIHTATAMHKKHNVNRVLEQQTSVKQRSAIAPLFGTIYNYDLHQLYD